MIASSLIQRFKSSVVTKIRGTTPQSDGRIQDPQIAQWRQSQGGPALDTHFPSIIERIDDDVLISIFLATLKIADSANPPMSRTHPAVVISHVCQRWREVALAVGALWKKIHLVIPSYPRGWIDRERHEMVAWKIKLLHRHQMMKPWIPRARETRLHVMVSEGWTYPSSNGSYYGEEGYSELAGLIDLLLETSPRWKELGLELSFVPSQTPKFPTTRFLSLPPQDDPVLTHVRLDIDWVHAGQPIPGLLLSKPSMLGGASLCSLTVSSGTMLHHDLMDLPILWSALKHLDFRGYASSSTRVFGQSQALQILRSCPNLVSCYLALTNDSNPSPNLGNPITLRCLENITIRPFKWDFVKGFAPSLILPSLHKFTVQSITGSPCSPLHYSESGLCKFTERFGGTLRDVNLQYITLTQDALRQCLANLPNVRSLTLTDASWARVSKDCAKIDTELLRDLTPQFDVVECGGADCLKVSRQPLCPMMEELTLTATLNGGGSELALVDLIEMRWKAWSIGSVEEQTIGRLKTVTWNGYWEKTLDVADELRRRGVDTDRFLLRT